jgi:hypothetical protein
MAASYGSGGGSLRRQLSCKKRKYGEIISWQLYDKLEKRNNAQYGSAGVLAGGGNRK